MAVVLTCAELHLLLTQGETLYLFHCARVSPASVRIPGAFDLVLEQVNSMSNLVSLLSHWGIDKKGVAVCYQDEGMEVACEAWWLLRSLGRHNSVLQGGLREWISQGFPVTSELARPIHIDPNCTFEVPTTAFLRETDIRSLQALGQVQVVSTDPSIPQTVFFDPAAGLSPTGHLLSPSLLQERMSCCGIELTADKPTVVVGEQASIVLLQLANAGWTQLCVGHLKSGEFYSVPSASEFRSPMETVYMDVQGSDPPTHSRSMSLASLQPARSSAKVGRVERCAECRLL